LEKQIVEYQTKMKEYITHDNDQQKVFWKERERSNIYSRCCDFFVPLVPLG
jgi:hypothetical protein